MAAQITSRGGFLLGTHISSGGFPCLRFLLHISHLTSHLAVSYFTSRVSTRYSISYFTSQLLGWRRVTSHISVCGRQVISHLARQAQKSPLAFARGAGLICRVGIFRVVQYGAFFVVGCASPLPIHVIVI